VATQPDTPPLRADAERNRRRLLDAAAAAFAEHGLDVSVSEIARRAEVGKGTLFRRFPTKDDLIAAIVVDRFGGLVAEGKTLLDRDDAGAALREWMGVCARQQSEDRGLLAAVSGSALDNAGIKALHAEFLELTHRLLERAQEAGAVRRDVTAVDIMLLSGSICEAASNMHGVVPDLWRRYLDLVLDGLRPEAAHPLSHPAPTLEQVGQAMQAKLEGARHGRQR
jgi:AcrR family transcriptional regulator